jgi:nanoRNase/pAp phosphatase (c-di-AMP/oligoRNAs hydrolase)
MLPKNPGQWERIDRFLMSFSADEKVALVHDADPDGLCSAVLMNKLLQRLRGKPADLHLTPPKGTRNTVHPDTIAALKKKRVSKVIFTDLGVHEDAKLIKKLEKDFQMLIIDHHSFFSDITSERTVLAMPQLIADDIEPARYASTKIAYDIANRHTGMEDCDWIAAIGIISDMASSAWPDFLGNVFARHELKPNPKDWFRTDLGSVSGMFFSAMTIDEKNVNYCFDTLMRATEPKGALKDKKLLALRRAFDREINTWVQRAPKLMEKHPDKKLIWYEVKPKYRINSPVATILSLKPQYNDWVVLILEVGRDVVKISGRCQSQSVAVNRLLKESVKGLRDAAGGGHVPAAGAQLRTRDLPVFRQRILDGLGKNLYTTKPNQQTIAKR